MADYEQQSLYYVWFYRFIQIVILLNIFKKFHITHVIRKLSITNSRTSEIIDKSHRFNPMRNIKGSKSRNSCSERVTGNDELGSRVLLVHFNCEWENLIDKIFIHIEEAPVHLASGAIWVGLLEVV